MTTYLLDANVFIQAKNSHYAFDIVPAFWQWIEQAHQAGTVYTVEKVGDEILPGGDDLATWMKTLPKAFRTAATAADQSNLHAVASWAATGNAFTQAAVADFLSSADYYLVAQALTLGFTVVTHETPDPNSKKRVKIPDACNAFIVPWMSPFKMPSAEKVRFNL